MTLQKLNLDQYEFKFYSGSETFSGWQAWCMDPGCMHGILCDELATINDNRAIAAAVLVDLYEYIIYPHQHHQRTPTYFRNNLHFNRYT